MSLSSWWFNKLLEVILASVSWNKAGQLANQDATVGNPKSSKFETKPHDDIMDVDSAKSIYNATKDLTLTNVEVLAVGSGNVIAEVGYGPTVDSVSGWTKLWERQITVGSPKTVPRTIHLPAGNYLTVTMLSGTATAAR